MNKRRLDNKVDSLSILELQTSVSNLQKALVEANTAIKTAKEVSVDDHKLLVDTTKILAQATRKLIWQKVLKWGLLVVVVVETVVISILAVK